MQPGEIQFGEMLHSRINPRNVLPIVLDVAFVDVWVYTITDYFMMSNALDLLLTYKNQKLLVLIFLLSVLDTMRVSGSTFLRY
ncbi:hypothetical protein H8356DRAFT_1332497 [Neocallimastix lanati (nom. inval.)]|nr:hypothetical protein H8356DRAFT_1332497 [Neocallimastix sp. JGI-2020a]